MHTRRIFLRTSVAATAAILTQPLRLRGAGRPLGVQPTPPADVQFIGPADVGYAEAREVYNAGIVAQPVLIALCASELGVQRALERANTDNSPVAVKAGGHSFEGFCLNDDGLVVNVSGLRDMKLDAKTGIFRAGAGCRLEEVNRFLLARGRFLPAGSCASVGLAGLTLGGGYGMFARKWGLTCDHLRGVRLVDGAGNIRDSRDEPELLWACRGGGNGHFGVVTQLTFQTRIAPPAFRAWKFRVYKLDAEGATRLLDEWFQGTAGLPNEAFSAWIMNGSQVTVLVTTTGAPDQKGVASLRQSMSRFSGKTTSAGPSPLTTSMRWYYGDAGPVFFKNASAGYYNGISDIAPALPAIFDQVLTVPGLVFQINTMGGAIATGPESAYPHRALSYLGESQAYWTSAAHAARLKEAIGRIRDSIAKAGIVRHYANYPDRAFKNWPTAYYGEENYQRLQQLKRSLDPNNRIRHDQSVKL